MQSGKLKNFQPKFVKFDSGNWNLLGTDSISNGSEVATNPRQNHEELFISDSHTGRTKKSCAAMLFAKNESLIFDKKTENRNSFSGFIRPAEAWLANVPSA
jgi:hypothetical protein